MFSSLKDQLLKNYKSGIIVAIVSIPLSLY